LNNSPSNNAPRSNFTQQIVVATLPTPTTQSGFLRQVMDKMREPKVPESAKRLIRQQLLQSNDGMSYEI